MTKPGYAMVHEDDHPIFGGRAGATRLRVYTRLARRANTSKGTKGRPLGHVVVSQAEQAADLGLSEQAVRSHLKVLRSAGLIVEWRAPVRGQVLKRADGKWSGLATEYLVCALASDADVEEARQRKMERDARAAARPGRNRVPTGQGNRRPRDAESGQFTPGLPLEIGRLTSSDPMPTATVVAVPTATVTAVPTATTVAPYETLVFETLEVETLNTKGAPCREHSLAPQSSPSSSRNTNLEDRGYTNRPAFLALRDAVERGLLPETSDGDMAGVAYMLTDESGTVAEINDAVRLMAACYADNLQQLGEEVVERYVGLRDLAQEALDTCSPMDYEDVLATASAEWRSSTANPARTKEMPA